jgi:hypothetical protein
MERWTLRWKAGDSLRLTVELSDEAGAVMLDDTHQFTWTISGTEYPVTITADGTVELELTPEQTRALSEGWHELTITTENGERRTVLLGSARRSERAGR